MNSIALVQGCEVVTARRRVACGAQRKALLAGFLAMTLAGGFLSSAGPALAASPLSWATPVRADDQPPFASPTAITGVSCPSTGLCVGVDSVGDILISTDPTGGSGAWTKTYAGANSTGVESFTGVSCPSTKLCVAIDSEGDVVTSTDPAGAAITWTKTEVVPRNGEGAGTSLEAVSCPSNGLCVATDDHGDVLTSSNPTSGAWTKVNVDPLHGLRGVSCPSTRLCLAIATEGNMVSSTNPTGGASAWAKTNVDGSHNLLDVSCVSENLCVATDNFGDVLTASEPTGGKSAWQAATVNSSGLIEHVSCAPSGMCVALDGNEAITTSEPAGGTPAWTSASIETSNQYGHDPALDAAACPATQLCVLGDESGAVATSTEPMAGASAWTVSNLEIGDNALRGVSCPSAGLCVAVGEAGNIVTSTDPTGGAGTWSDSHVDSIGGLESVSCPTMSLCVAVDSAGDVATSTDPAGGTKAWTVGDVDKARRLTSVSCPSVSLCVAIDTEGGVVTSTDPAGGVGAWSVTEMGASFGFLNDLSCPSASLCVAVESDGYVMTLTEPERPSGRTWTVTHVTEEILDGVSCSPELCAIVTLSDGVLTSTSPAGGAATWTSSHIEGLNGLADVSCQAINLCLATAFAGNGSAGNVIASTNPTGGTSSWVEDNVYGLRVRPPQAAFELYTKDLTGVSCAQNLCVVVDTQGDVMVGTRSDAAPANTSPPVVSGTPGLGQTPLSCSIGSWTGYPPPTFAYEWLRDGTAITGANAGTYVVQAADQGHGLACQVTASNSVASETATSNTLQVPLAQAPGGLAGSGGESPGTLADIVGNAFVLNGIQSVARRGTVKVTLTLPGPGTLEIVGRASAAQLAAALRTANKRRATPVIVRRRLTVSRAGRIVATLVPTGRAKTVLARQGKLRAAVTITYTPKGGEPRSIVRHVTFRLTRQR